MYEAQSSRLHAKLRQSKISTIGIYGNHNCGCGITVNINIIKHLLATKLAIQVQLPLHEAHDRVRWVSIITMYPPDNCR